MEISISIRDQRIPAHTGELLSDVLFRHGYAHARPCGGKGVCGKCRVLVNGRPELACRYRLQSDVTVELCEEGEILSESGADMADGQGTELVLDIGTTTLAMALIDPEVGRIIRVLTANNPQRRFGADVISRMEHARAHGVSELTEMIRAEISRMIGELGGSREVLHVAGNTTMLHILAGVDPSPMGTAPYTPVFLEERWVSGASMGLPAVGTVRLLPSIAAFVGADLVAGLCHVGLPSAGYRLLVDLGTNAEVILFSRDRILATAAAAGPCFEGANISCGMSAVPGAVYAYDEAGVRTIGDAAPRGLCGTGLVDVIAQLLRRGILDESGYLEDESFALCPGVVLTQKDIRQYQLAKSAVLSAILTLMQNNSVAFSNIDALYISGGFSTKINVDNAVLTGLLPRELRDVTVSVGNSSLLGTVKAACNSHALDGLVEKAQYVDLSADPVFSELFIEQMGFSV